jgi:hypothetical protein
MTYIPIIPTCRFWFDGESADFEFNFQGFPGGDGLVTMCYGETAEEGAPIAVHAFYFGTVTEDVPFICHRFIEEFIEEEHTPNSISELDELVADLLRPEYDRRMAAGMGDWVRGDNLIRRGVATTPTFGSVGALGSLGDAYEPNDPKNPEYVDRILDTER